MRDIPQKMKSTKKTNSFAETSLETYRLLSAKQRAQAIKHVASSFLQATLEVVSLTAVIPLLLSLLNNDETLFPLLALTSYPLTWQTIVASVAIIFITKNLISLFLTHYQSQFAHKVFISFSEQLYQRFYMQSWTEYLKQNSADTVRKIKHTPSDFTNYILQGYLMLITDVSICVLMASVLMWYNIQILIIIIILCAPIVVFYYWFRKSILARVSESFRDLTPRANVAITQGIDSFAEAKIYQKENFFIDHFMTYNKATSQYLANLKSSSNIPSRLFEIVGILCFVAVITYSKFYPSAQQDLLLLLGLLSVAIYRIIPSLNRILISLSQIKAYSYSVTELKESFAQKANGEAPKKQILSFERSIEFKNVSFQYSKSTSQVIFNDLNTTIKKGDFLVLEGPSGSGKTTFIHILAGLVEGYNGQVLIDERVLSRETQLAWQSKLGFVQQASVVLQETILHNIAFGEEDSDINISEIEKALENAGLYEFVNTMPMQINSPVGENGLTLSGGQRQRLVLARALYRKPEILLLDEVTNQLDYENKIKILATLKELSLKGMTIVLASHDPVVRSFATRVLHLKDKSVYEG